MKIFCSLVWGEKEWGKTKKRKEAKHFMMGGKIEIKTHKSIIEGSKKGRNMGLVREKVG